jgi:hypothetical protein
MNYKRIYDCLITKTKIRNLSIQSGTTVHHIVPRCIGGSDCTNNKVRLFTKEHCLAHLLLSKIYLHEGKLIFAARMMYSAHSIKKYASLIEKNIEFIKEKWLDSEYPGISFSSLEN